MRFQQYQNAYGIPFKLTSARDGFSPLPGLSPLVLLSQNGAPYVSAIGTPVEVGGGAYYLQPSLRDFDTPGSLVLYASALGAVPEINLQSFVVAGNVLQLAVLLQFLPEQQPVDFLLERIRSVQYKGGFHLKGRIFQAAQGFGISCESCFDSTLVLAPPVQTLFGVPVPSIPDQPIVSLDDGSVIVSMGVVPGGFPLPALDGNTAGRVIWQAPASMAIYFAAGTFYVCMCMTINPSVPNPAQVIVENYTVFDIWATGIS